MDELDD